MSKGGKGLSRHGSHVIRFVIAAGALYLAFKGEDIGRIGRILLGLNIWVFAVALGLYVVSQFIFVARWYMLLKVQGISIGFWPAVRLHFLGLFYNNCLPGSVGGDFLRAWYVTRHTDKRLVAALSVFVDRVVGLVGLFIMAFCCWWFVPVEGRRGSFEIPYGNGGFSRLAEYKWILTGAAVLFAVIAAIFLAVPKGRRVLVVATGVVRKYSTIILHKSHEAIRIYWNRKLVLLLALFLTFCCQGVFIVGLWLIGVQIGTGISGKYYFVFFPISWLLGMLPISVGGAGIMEWWLKDIFVRVCGAAGEKALVLALCQRIIWLLASLPGAAIHLLGAHLPKDFFVDYK